ISTARGGRSGGWKTSAIPFGSEGTMHVLITGAGGMIGRKLVERLARDGRVAGKVISRLTLHDIEAPRKPQVDYRVDTHGGDISVPGEAAALVVDAPDLIFHLAAVVSGEAEADFDKGY